MIKNLIFNNSNATIIVNTGNGKCQKNQVLNWYLSNFNSVINWYSVKTLNSKSTYKLKQKSLIYLKLHRLMLTNALINK